MLTIGGDDGGNAKAAEKSRREELEAEKKRIREVSAALHHSVRPLSHKKFFFEILFRNKNFQIFLSKLSTFTLKINF